MAIRQHVGALFTDLYEVTMAQAYWAERMSGTAVFEIFFRKLPPGRSYIMAAGLAMWSSSSKRFDSTSRICVTCVAWASFPTSS